MNRLGPVLEQMDKTILAKRPRPRSAMGRVTSEAHKLSVDST